MKERKAGLKKTYDEAKLHVYANALISNWIRRDPVSVAKHG